MATPISARRRPRPQHLVINEAEAEVVRQIYRWCVEEQLSSYAIHRRLTLQGVPPRKAKHGRWAQSSVIEILRDSLYKGEAYYNRTQPGRCPAAVWPAWAQRSPPRQWPGPHAAPPERMDSGPGAGAH